MLCAGLQKPFCDTMPSTASQTCDVPDTDVICNDSTVGKYPQPSGDDLHHMCRAFNEHMGEYVHCQAHQLHFLPQEHVLGTYDVCASYMYLYS